MANTTELKAKLLAEKTRIENAMRGVAHPNPEISGDWQPTPAIMDGANADPNDVATEIEAFEDNAAVEVELEAQLVEVDAALARIEAGTYGKCRICGADIEDARLGANPAATTCIAHREG